MNIIKTITESTKINDLKIIALDTFKDHRGEIWTVYSDTYTDLKFVADKVTISRFGVLRGFHGDARTTKLITCLSGQFQLAVADARKNSRTYGNVETYLISDDEPTVVIVPRGCLNAHLCLSDKCVFYYKWSEHYKGPEEQVTIAWNDPTLNIDWAMTNPILSERDNHGTAFSGTSL